MRRDQNVAWGCLEKREAVLEVFKNVRIVAAASKSKSVGGDRSQAIGIYNGSTQRRFAGLPRPAGTSGSVARRQVRGELEFSDDDLLAVTKFVHICNRGNRSPADVLGVTAANFAGFHHTGAPRAGKDTCSAEPLQFCYTAGVIIVHMRIQNYLHVFDLKARDRMLLAICSAD